MAVVLGAAAVVLVAGCGGSGGGDKPRPADQRELRAYVSSIEPLRLGVNRLLDDADPILRDYREHVLTAAQAQHALGRLERRFASYMRRVAAVTHVPPELVAAQRAYAGTYAKEDVYLRALVAALPTRDWSRLPHTEDSQRKVLVAWRAKLALQAARLQVTLPDDIARVGRDEVAPSPLGEGR